MKWTVKFTPTIGSPETKTYEPKYEYGGLIPEEAGFGTELKLNLGKAKVGVYEIVGSAITDDLGVGDETVEASTDTVTVKPSASEALAVKWLSPAREEVRASEQDQLTAEVLDEAKPVTSDIKRVIWEFGDGTSEEEGSAGRARQSSGHQARIRSLRHQRAHDMQGHAEGRSGTRSRQTADGLAPSAVGNQSQGERSREAAAKKKAEEEAAAAKKKTEEEEAAAKKKRKKNVRQESRRRSCREESRRRSCSQKSPRRSGSQGKRRRSRLHRLLRGLVLVGRR